ncbi:protein of unknown function [Xenorhabdus poinarii G6]|uniref:Uncharacterized protein n=1 Tax=Xenorhabdus poinarii G6 TaxID=1354304 RepID=A0A068R346_9GAMM|nr:hypothetical protein [Xenorhabdus poinarii]CDG21608.1 protein of unknown function [Xenorhabdus poinarii G6]
MRCMICYWDLVKGEHKGRASLNKAMSEVFERLREKRDPFLLGLLEEYYYITV